MWSQFPLGSVVHASPLDYTILAVYFLVVLGIGPVAKLTIKTEHRLLPVRPLAARVDHRPGLYGGEPGCARDPRDGGQRRAVRRRHRSLLLGGDIRRIIAALFELYGITLTVTGIVGSHAVKTKASGINIDLWTGIAMIVFGLLMLAWALLRPTVPEPSETRGQGSGRIRRAPAT